MINPLLNFLKKYVPLRVGLTNLALVITQLFYLLRFTGKEGLPNLTFSASDIFILLYSFITLNILIQLINVITSNSRKLWFTASIILLFLYNILFSYQYRVKSSFDFAVIRDNLSDIFYSKSIITIVSDIGLLELSFALAFSILFIVLEYKKKLVSRQRQDKPLLPKFVFMATLYAAVIIVPLTTNDQMTCFFKSVYSYYFQNITPDVTYHPSTYPLIKKGNASFAAVSAAPVPSGRPNVFIIMIESFNANFVETRSPEGIEYTPVFNSHIKEGLYVEKFYGNSIQTCKGQLAVFFSMIPSFKGKVFVDYSDTKFYSLPQMMRDNGYTTIFFQGYADINFDNTHNFLGKNGFSYVESVQPMLRPEDKEHLWGWGVQDDVLYKHFFERLDRINTQQKDKAPFFAGIATISNHMMFNYVPPHLRKLYPQPQSWKEWYANSINFSDSCLAQFFKELESRKYLENSIVIITGDHSFPMGEHGIYHNEASFFDEFFRTPFLMIWKNRLSAERIKSIPYCQLDIAPSIVDLTQVKSERNHFEGVSMYGVRKIHPIYLIQPYNGGYIAVLNYPYKYIKPLKNAGKREMLFRLDRDPKETLNLIDYTENATKLKTLQDKLQFIYLNQMLLEHNEVWLPAQ